MAGFDDESEQRGPDFTRGGVLAQEQSPDNVDSANENQFKYPQEAQSPSGSQNGARWKQTANKILGRNKGFVFGAAGAGIVVAIAMSFFTLAIAPIAFLDGTMPDLNTAVGGFLMAHNSLTVSKMANTSEAVSGCKTLSITCKFRTMSKEQIARYRKAGFTIEVEGKTLLGRSKVKSISFRDTTYSSPKQFLEAKRNNLTLRTADLRANNGAYLATKTARFANAVLTRFGITKQKPGLSGSKADRLNQLLTASGSSEASQVSFRQVGEDQNGNPIYELDGDTQTDANGNRRTYSEAEKLSAEKALSYKPNAGLTKLRSVVSTTEFQAVAGAASITGWVDLGCSVYSMFGAAAVAAKINTTYDLVRFGQTIFPLIQSIKAGDETGTSDNLAALGELFTKTDDRKQIWNGSELVDNPNYGSSVMTSPLVAMSGDGKVRAVGSETLQFTSGMSVEKILGEAGELYAAFEQYVAKGTCALVQNWFVRGAGLVVGIAAAVASGSASVAGQIALTAGIMVAFYAAQAYLSNAIHGPDLLTAFNDGSTEAVGSALWLSLASIMGTSAASSGLVPGNVSETLGYQTAALNEANAEYAALEREDGQNNPFDVTNQYSFFGSAARQVGNVTNYGESPISVLKGIVALATGRTISSSDTAYATADLSAERFQQCADKSYATLDIAADAGCNIRYIMMPEDITRLQQDNSAMTVAKWMEDSGYVDKDTETGLPIGYTPLDTAQAQNAVMEFVTGTVDGIINQFYSFRSYGSNAVAAEYGKYLDFCAYRTIPYGDQFSNEQSSAINGVEEGWVTGAKCMEHSEMMSNFRVYTNLLATQQAEDEERPTVGQGLSTAIAANGSCPVGQSVSGVTRGWDRSGNQQPITLCAIPDTSMSVIPHWKDSRYEGTSAAGITQIAVNSEAAQALADAAQKAKADGVTLTASIGYRSLYEQCSIVMRSDNLGRNNPQVKEECPSWITPIPGNWTSTALYSNHMMGYSIDFTTASESWMRKCVKGNTDGAADNRCFGFYDDVMQSQGWDGAHFTYKPLASSL